MLREVSGASRRVDRELTLAGRPCAIVTPSRHVLRLLVAEIAPCPIFNLRSCMVLPCRSYSLLSASLLAFSFRIGTVPRARIFGQCSDRCLGDDAFVYRPRLAARPLTLLPCKRHARRAQLHGGLARPFVRSFTATEGPAVEIFSFLISRFTFEECTIELYMYHTEAVSRWIENESDTLLYGTTRDLITAR